MSNLPSCGAMDAAAGGSGPGTAVLPFITGAEPEAVLRYATDLGQRMLRLAGLVEELTRTQDRLRVAWPAGSASQAAGAKLTAGTSGFQRVFQAVQGAIADLRAAAELITMMQTAYRSVVGSVNPTVASLMSNPYTRGAATSLSVSTTASLHSYLTGVKSSLDAIGMTKILTVVTTLATIATEIERLLPTGNPSPSRIR